MAGFLNKIDINVYVNDELSEITLSVKNRTVGDLRKQLIESGYQNMEKAIFKICRENQIVRINNLKDLNNGDKIYVEFAAVPHNSQFPTQSFKKVCCAKKMLDIGGSATLGTDGASGANQFFEQVLTAEEVKVKEAVTMGGKVIKKANQ